MIYGMPMFEYGGSYFGNYGNNTVDDPTTITKMQPKKAGIIPSGTPAPQTMNKIDPSQDTYGILSGGNSNISNNGYVNQGLNLATGLVNSFAQQNASKGNVAMQNSGTQQAVDMVAGSVVPGYNLLSGIGKWAQGDYAVVNNDSNSVDYGMLADKDKYNFASTASGFMGPNNLISGISGDGWTASQRAEHIEGKYKDQRNANRNRLNAQNRQRDINQGLGSRFWDQNQTMMQAAYGGALPVLGESYADGGYLDRYGASRQDLPQITNYNSGHSLLEDGGELEQQPQVKGSMITKYNEGGTHQENPNGGVPVDSRGNKSVTSNARPIASTEEGELSYFSKKNGKSFVFSNKIFV